MDVRSNADAPGGPEQGQGPTPRQSDWLIGGGETGDLIRSKDWAGTPLGPHDSWPHTLRTVVQLVVESQFPTALLWGHDLILLYNDAYRIICADKHPRAMGRSTREIWPEVWHINEPIFKAVLERGETVYLEDKLFPVDRSGRREEAYFTLCYSPVRDEIGAVAGSLVTLLETTTRVRERDALVVALQENEERLHLAIDATEIGAFDFHPQTGRLVWSEHAKRHFGLGPDAEVSYRTFLRGLHPDDRDRVDRIVQNTLKPESGGEYATEYRTVGIEDGKQRWLSARGRVLFGPGGRASRFIGVTHDITERKRVESDLRRSRGMLAEAEALSHTGAWEWDVRRDEWTFSDEWLAIHGVSTPSLTRDERLRLAHPADVAAIEEAMDGVRRGGLASYDLEHRIIRQDTGEMRFVHARGRSLREGDEVVKVYGFAQDITDRKRSEQALRDSEAHIRDLADNISQFAWMADEKGWMFWYNKRWFDYTGTTLEEMQGWGWQKVHHPDHVNRVVEKVRRCFESGEVWEDTFPLRGRDGQYRWFLSRALPIKDEQGRVVRWFGTNTDITDQKRTEEALRQNDQILRAIMEHVPIGITICDASGRFVLSSHAGIALTRRSPGLHDAAAYVSQNQVFAADGTTPLAADDLPMMRAAKRGEVVRNAETIVDRADGTRIVVLSDAAPIWTDGGEITGAVLAYQDVTERKRVEEALRESGERHRTVVENLSEGLMLFDAQGTLVYQNPAAARIHGFERSREGRLDRAVLTTTWRGWDLAGSPLPPEAWPMSRVLRHERFENQVLRAQRVETGSEFYASYNGCPVYDAKGNLAFGFITIRDITEEVQGQQALKVSEEKFAKAFRGSAAGVTITRLHDGQFIDVNPTYTRITGYDREDLVGKAPRTIWKRPADREEFVRALRENGSVEGVEVHLVKKNGEEWTGLVSAQVITLGGDEVIISSVVDITRRQRAEAELKEREADLRDALERLAEADRRKDEFIAILSHELRNPLAPIRYALPVLQRERLSEPAGRAVTVIDRQVDHLARLVDDLLDVSRITGGKIELRREHVALASVVNAAVEAASPVIAAARHAFEILVPDEPIWLHADAARVAQVITNLLNNSAKYTPRGGRITLEGRQERDAAVIVVRDNGMGMVPDALPTVFDMFRQVNHPDKSQGGLGIGLGLAKRLVEMHGGTIHAHSAGIGQGSTFVVRLPVAKDAEPVATQSPQEASAAGRRLKVLIVDDNADLVEMLGMLVQAAGHDVRKALDGRSAVSAALSYRPDVVLLDLGLPVMSGIEVARELRTHAATAQARLVALTGWGQAEDRRQTEEAGFEHHLTKPTDPKALERLLAEFATSGGAHA